MDKKVTMKKDGVIKDIDVNLLSEYLHMGWIKVVETKNKNVFKKEDK